VHGKSGTDIFLSGSIFHATAQNAGRDGGPEAEQRKEKGPACAGPDQNVHDEKKNAGKLLAF
jgi:hypothetical protein